MMWVVVVVVESIICSCIHSCVQWRCLSVLYKWCWEWRCLPVLYIWCWEWRCLPVLYKWRCVLHDIKLNMTLLLVPHAFSESKRIACILVKLCFIKINEVAFYLGCALVSHVYNLLIVSCDVVSLWWCSNVFLYMTDYETSAYFLENK
jgi:hypothetical protein